MPRPLKPQIRYAYSNSLEFCFLESGIELLFFRCLSSSLINGLWFG